MNIIKQKNYGQEEETIINFLMITTIFSLNNWTSLEWKVFYLRLKIYLNFVKKNLNKMKSLKFIKMKYLIFQSIQKP